jgi:hypothetical protein
MSSHTGTCFFLFDSGRLHSSCLLTHNRAIKNKLDLEKDDADGEYGMGSGLITKQEARYRHR